MGMKENFFVCYYRYSCHYNKARPFSLPFPIYVMAERGKAFIQLQDEWEPNTNFCVAFVKGFTPLLTCDIELYKAAFMKMQEAFFSVV